MAIDILRSSLSRALAAVALAAALVIALPPASASATPMSYFGCTANGWDDSYVRVLNSTCHEVRARAHNYQGGGYTTYRYGSWSVGLSHVQYGSTGQDSGGSGMLKYNPYNASSWIIV